MTYFSPEISYFPICETINLSESSSLDFVINEPLGRSQNLIRGAKILGYLLTIPLRMIMTIWNVFIATLTSALCLLTAGLVKPINEYAIKAWKNAFNEFYSSFILAVDLPLMLVCHIAGAIFEPSAGKAGWQALRGLASPLESIRNCDRLNLEEVISEPVRHPLEPQQTQEELMQTRDQRHQLESQRIQEERELQRATRGRQFAQKNSRLENVLAVQELSLRGQVRASERPHLGEILDKTLFTDVKLVVTVDANTVLEHSAEFSSHKLILSIHSDYFRSLFFETASLDRVNLHISNPAVIKGAEQEASLFDKFLRYLYSPVSSDLENLPSESLLPLAWLARQLQVNRLSNKIENILSIRSSETRNQGIQDVLETNHSIPQAQEETLERSLEEIIEREESSLIDPGFILTSQNAAYLLQMLDEDLFSDVTLVVVIKVNSENTILEHRAEFPAHKMVLFARSEYFRTMFSSSMLESNKNEIILLVDDPKIIEGWEDKLSLFNHFLRYIYSHSTDLSTLSPEQVLLLTGLANQYLISSLTTRCSALLHSKINSELSLDDLATIWQRACVYQFLGVKKRCERELCYRVSNETHEQINEFAVENEIEIVKKVCREFSENQFIEEHENSTYRLNQEIYVDSINYPNLSVHEICYTISVAKELKIRQLAVKSIDQLKHKMDSRMTVEELKTLRTFAREKNIDTIQQWCDTELAINLNNETLDQINTFAQQYQIDFLIRNCNQFRNGSFAANSSVNINVTMLVDEIVFEINLIKLYSIDELMHIASFIHQPVLPQVIQEFNSQRALQISPGLVPACIIELCDRLANDFRGPFQSSARNDYEKLDWLSDAHDIQTLKEACTQYRERRSVELPVISSTWVNRENIDSEIPIIAMSTIDIENVDEYLG